MPSHVLDHSTADVIRHLMINLGHGVLPPTSAGDAWPIYRGNEPPAPDNCITVYDAQGVDHGRLMVTSERVIDYGFQIRVRSQTYEVGHTKARQLQVECDDVYQDEVTIDSTTYIIHAINLTSDVIPLGKEEGSTSRYLFTINGTVTMKNDT